jgi:hypothetical protein
MSNIIRDARVDSLVATHYLILPTVKQDTNAPLKGKLIYNRETDVPSYADGTEWHDLASGGDINDLQAQIDTINIDVTNISNAPVILTGSNASFPSGKVIAGGTGIDIDTSTPGTVTINASSTLLFTSLSAKGGTLLNNYVIPLNAINPIIYACGAGGGGGGPNTVLAAAGGGGGGSGAALIYSCAPGDEITYTIGDAGAGGAPGNPGTVGGDTLVTINGQDGPLLSGGGGGAGGGSIAAGSAGIPAIEPLDVKGYPICYFNGSSGGGGGLAGFAGGNGYGTAFKFAGGIGGFAGVDGGGGGGGGGSIFGRGGDGGDSGLGGFPPLISDYGAGGGASSGVVSVVATGGDGRDGEIILTFWS